MGILKSRDELVAVTCAILKDDVRASFFAAVKKQAGGRFERASSATGAGIDSIRNWMSGKEHIPYHALQQLTQEFRLDLPAVSELRREYRKVIEPQKQKPQRGGRKQPRREDQSARDGRKKYSARRAVSAPPGRGERRERGSGRTSRSAAQTRPRRRKQPRPPAPKNDPKRGKSTASANSKTSKTALLEKRAYWTGVLLARGRRGDSMVILDADRHMGQNFAATWARLTTEIFGVKPALKMSADRKTQSASFPAAKAAEFLDRLSFKPGTGPVNAPGAPRWAWSNPAWKIAFLKGVIDASARFQRTPALRLFGLSKRLTQSTLRLIFSFGLQKTASQDTSLSIGGTAALKDYFERIGTDNLKIRDQLRAFLKSAKGGRAASAESEAASGAAKKPGGGRGRSRGRRRAKPAAAAGPKVQV